MSKRKYSEGSQDEVRKEMDLFKHGKAHSGSKLKPVKSREQTEKGMKVPKKKP